MRLKLSATFSVEMAVLKSLICCGTSVLVYTLHTSRLNASLPVAPFKPPA